MWNHKRCVGQAGRQAGYGLLETRWKHYYGTGNTDGHLLSHADTPYVATREYFMRCAIISNFYPFCVLVPLFYY